MAVHQNALEGLTDALVKTNRREERVVLVNEQNETIGTENKGKAHLSGALHRAFSIFVINSTGQLLMQKRAATKYHSRNLWSNTCCGHPRPGETIARASRRRLWEEMGFESNLKEVFSFVYCANLEDGLIENEYDHVLAGFFDGVPKADPAEISQWKWVNLAEVSRELKKNPENYTYWFRLTFDRFLESFHF